MSTLDQFLGGATTKRAALTGKAVFDKDGTFAVPEGVDRMLLTMTGAGGGLSSIRIADNNQTGTHGLGVYHPATGFWSFHGGGGSVRRSTNFSSWTTLSFSGFTKVTDNVCQRENAILYDDRLLFGCFLKDGTDPDHRPFPHFDFNALQMDRGPVLAGATSSFSNSSYAPLAVDRVTGRAYRITTTPNGICYTDDFQTVSLVTGPTVQMNGVVAHNGKLFCGRFDSAISNAASFATNFFYSADGGETLQPASVTGLNVAGSVTLTGVAHSDDFSVLYMCGYSSSNYDYVFRSSDGGATWTQIYSAQSASYANSSAYLARFSLRGIECTPDGSRAVFGTYVGSVYYMTTIDASGTVLSQVNFQSQQVQSLWRKRGVIYACIGYYLYVVDAERGSPRATGLPIDSYLFTDRGLSIVNGWVDDTGIIYLRGGTSSSTYMVLIVPPVEAGEGSAVAGSFGTVAVAGGGSLTNPLGGASGVPGINPDLFGISQDENPLLLSGRAGGAGYGGAAAIMTQPATGRTNVPGSGAWFAAIASGAGAGGAESSFRYPVAVTPGEVLTIVTGESMYGGNGGVVMLEW